VSLAKRWLDPEARAILVLLSKTRGILAYSDKQRLFSEQQRLAMLTRDGGCSYPGCDAALGWLDAHHVTDHQHTRPHQRRRRRPRLRHPPRHLRPDGLDLPHAQRQTPLGPTRLARPATKTRPQPHARLTEQPLVAPRRPDTTARLLAHTAAR
jgi:hypothetical protein